MSFTAASIGLQLNGARQDLFGDLRLRYGIKVGLAGLLALFCTQLLRLPDDNWAILTVLVLMSPQFVGSIAFKAVMRIVGTVAGAFVGVWLVTDYTSTPAIFLPVLFLVMAFATYKFGQVGARQVPYAYFLLGLTTLTIATDGVTNPTQAWRIGIDRTEEIVVGIISSVLITSLLWPRYAREEFLEAARGALKTVGQLVSLRTRTYANSPNTPIKHFQPAAADAIQTKNKLQDSNTPPLLYSRLEQDVPCKREEIHHAFGRQLSVLRNLLGAGSRESTFFSARLSDYNAFLVSLINLFQAGLEVGRHKIDSSFLEDLQYETESLLAAISEEFDILSSSHPPGEKLHSSRMNEAFASFEEKVNKIRDQGVLVAAPPETLTAFAGHFAVLRSLRDELNNIRSAMEGLPRLGQPPKPKPHREALPAIDWFWVKVGIKGSLAAVISIVFLRWLHPPGSSTVPLMAWTLAIMGRPSLRAGGTGDLRAFQTVVCASLLLAACAVLLLLITPFLANYGVMNLALFLVLFAFGFITARIPGITFGIQITYLTISAFVALNPQAPVSSQTIIDTFIGLMFGMLIGAVAGRLLWPVLPQRILRDSMLTLFTQLKALAGGDPHQERIRTQLAILPVDALGALRQIRITGCSEEEKLTITGLVRALQVLVARMTELVRLSSALRPMTIPSDGEGGLVSRPDITAQMLRPQFESLEIEFKQMLDAFAECFREGDCRRQLPTLRGALSEMDHAVQQLRERNMLTDLTLEAPLQVLDLVDRYHATAEALDECGRLLCSLQIQRYWGDYGL